MFEEIGETTGSGDEYYRDILNSLRLILKTNDKLLIEPLIKKYTDKKSGVMKKRNFAFCYVNILDMLLDEYGFSFNDILGDNQIWR